MFIFVMYENIITLNSIWHIQLYLCEKDKRRTQLVSYPLRRKVKKS